MHFNPVQVLLMYFAILFKIHSAHCGCGAAHCTCSNATLLLYHLNLLQPVHVTDRDVSRVTYDDSAMQAGRLYAVHY